MIVTIGSDHGGYKVKGAISDWLLEHGYNIKDVGYESNDSRNLYFFFKNFSF